MAYPTTKLWMPCVGLDCDSNPNKYSDFSFWEHKSCSSTTLVQSDGYLGCEDGCSKYYIWNAWFKCSRHENYRQADIASLMNYIAAMETMCAKNETSEDASFYYELGDAIIAERNRRRAKK